MKRMKTETDSKNPETRATRPNKTLRRFGAIVAGTAVIAGGIGTVAGATHERHPNPLYRGDGLNLPDYMGSADVDESVVEVDLAAGTDVISEPAKADKALGDNLLVKLNKSLAVKTDRGIPRWDTVDGEMFGLSEKEFKKALGNIDPDLRQEIESKIEKDSDGTFWVNEKDATLKQDETSSQ